MIGLIGLNIMHGGKIMYKEDELNLPIIKYYGNKIANELIDRYDDNDSILFDNIVIKTNNIGDLISEEIINKVLEIFDEKEIRYTM